MENVRIEGSKAIGRFNHPMRSDLRQEIISHVGPWTAEEADRLNVICMGGLHFALVDGWLYVSAPSQR